MHAGENQITNVWLDTDVLHVDAAGTNIIVLDSYQAAVDLLEKKSSIYSGRWVFLSNARNTDINKNYLSISLRPRLPMVNELMGWDWNFGFMDYGVCVLLIHPWTAI